MAIEPGTEPVVIVAAHLRMNSGSQIGIKRAMLHGTLWLLNVQLTWCHSAKR
jgi:hypothetical protein